MKRLLLPLLAALALPNSINSEELPKNSSTKDQLIEYKQLFDEGLISEEEYSALKKKTLDL